MIKIVISITTENATCILEPKPLCLDGSKYSRT